MTQRLKNEGHRAIVGGLWDVIGPLQRDHLIGQDLKPTHHVLDVGCGALRGGVPIVGYLEPGGYFGIDISPQLLDAGYDGEICGTPLEARLDRDHLFATPDCGSAWKRDPVSGVIGVE